MNTIATLILILHFIGHGHDSIGYSLTQSNYSNEVMVEIINNERTMAGLPILVERLALDGSAEAKCKDMIDRDYWAHVSNDGVQPWKFFGDFGYKYRYAGENLTRDAESDEEAMRRFMNSETHKENILNPKFSDIGIGRCSGNLAGEETTIIVQHFGKEWR